MRKVNIKTYDIVSNPGFSSNTVKMSILPSSKNILRKKKIKNLLEFFDRIINDDDNEKFI